MEETKYVTIDRYVDIEKEISRLADLFLTHKVLNTQQYSIWQNEWATVIYKYFAFVTYDRPEVIAFEAVSI